MNGGLKRSPSREFGHCRDGYAVEFDLGGFSHRSLTVETEGEAQAIKASIEGVEGTSNVQVVRDA